MDGVNRTIVVSVVILMGAGLYRVLVTRQTIDPSARHDPEYVKQRQSTVTKVLVGGFVLAFIAALVDLAGGPISEVAGLLLALAVFTAIIEVVPDLFTKFARRG